MDEHQKGAKGGREQLPNGMPIPSMASIIANTHRLFSNARMLGGLRSQRNQAFRRCAVLCVPLLVLLDPSRDLGLPFLQLALKGTKISTPSGDRLAQELQIGDEVQTLTGR
jgi:hypothetical protein